MEQIVLMELRMLAEFLESAEDDFAELLEQKTNKDMVREKMTAEGALATAKARSKKLIGLFQKLYVGLWVKSICLVKERSFGK